VLLEGVLLIVDDCTEIELEGAGVPLDDVLGRNAGSNAMENAFAGQAQAHWHS